MMFMKLSIDVSWKALDLAKRLYYMTVTDHHWMKKEGKGNIIHVLFLFRILLIPNCALG